MNQKIPQIILPEESDTYKILQFENEGKPYLRFSQGNFSYHKHRDILSAFAREIDVIAIEEHKGNQGIISYLPENCSFKLCGGGLCKIELEQKEMFFFSDTWDYNLGIHENHLGKLRKELLQWDIKKVRI